MWYIRNALKCLQQMTLQEAQILVLRVLKQVMEEKLDQHNVQLAQVRVYYAVEYISYGAHGRPGYSIKRI